MQAGVQASRRGGGGFSEVFEAFATCPVTRAALHACGCEETSGIWSRKSARGKPQEEAPKSVEAPRHHKQQPARRLKDRVSVQRAVKAAGGARASGRKRWSCEARCGAPGRGRGKVSSACEEQRSRQNFGSSELA